MLKRLLVIPLALALTAGHSLVERMRFSTGMPS